MRVEITCANRVGILHEITEIFGDYRINVTSGELGGDSGDKVYLSAPGMLATQYRAIEQPLLRVPGVQRVRRIALIPSERRHFELDTLLRHVAEPVLSVDREGRVVAANLAAARAFGVNLDRVPGLQLQRFLPLLQVAELLRDFAVPRYGMPVTVRGRAYRLEWSPIALADMPGEVESLAGAVLTMQPQAPGEAAIELPKPVALWDFDRRRESCLQLQEMAALRSPLLIRGERGTGKSTFATAAHYLSPLAATGDCLCLQMGEGALPQAWPDRGTLILDDLHRLSGEGQRQLARRLRDLPAGLRPVGTCEQGRALNPALMQIFSELAITLPPLRTMRPAVPRFARALLRERQRDDETLGLDDAAGKRLGRGDWPDNFHGFGDHLQAAAGHCRRRAGSTIESRDLPQVDARPVLPWRDWSRDLSYREIMDKVEEALLRELLTEHRSTRELARRLDISHTAVANKLRKYGLYRRNPK
ncbi:TyrR/PhhR family helix-turn-helix DNA-binding protein [Microbulbifer halophilus]|uniref:TyrR/PhhR family helix-turn-helix DNA-binding protein n=1 Tax=Microbulbifer halophilus TaxID=453963 RepID=A0ABW5EE55_9GAMM|nr:TyrR/PhhR family helix-turn-helix DNA-binding protein [Microbulbifer halophilus]MCW8127347.1 sigma 54-interacting transcriptional regulator [Microbulbifer halophilus]